MSSDDSVCPEDGNSTDCLLRSLFSLLDDKIKTDDATTDWDPITFAFTVPVGLFGIFAAIFALITIYQAVLAAGPGRRKCIAQAIGPWSKLNSRKWSWTELRWYYEARTPVLDQHMVVGILNGLGDYLDGGEAYDVPKTTSASWIGFLDKCGLLTHSLLKQSWISRATDVDTLPADIPAVPAYAEVGCIITLSGATGARYIRIDTQSGLNTSILGSDFQFDFRNHPILGLIGAFSKRHKQGNRRTWPSRKHMLATFHHSKGGFNALVDDRPYYANALENPPDTFISNFLCYSCTNSHLCQAGSLFDKRDRHKLLWLLAGACPDIVMPSE
ncbi:hypothetical protein F5B20DRAFT_16339 [Whalleya microplaca]|nr:hypothetical protein F5B20DRAFT_16339 [Whalleya microplaca]